MKWDKHIKSRLYIRFIYWTVSKWQIFEIITHFNIFLYNCQMKYHTNDIMFRFKNSFLNGPNRKCLFGAFSRVSDIKIILLIRSKMKGWKYGKNCLFWIAWQLDAADQVSDTETYLYVPVSDTWAAVSIHFTSPAF